MKVKINESINICITLILYCVCPVQTGDIDDEPVDCSIDHWFIIYVTGVKHQLIYDKIAHCFIVNCFRVNVSDVKHGDDEIAVSFIVNDIVAEVAINTGDVYDKTVADLIGDDLVYHAR